ncbi:MAG: hypothetical protein ACFFG0_47660 [Candidatus Thorarchaeota archaeon]
MKKEKNNMDKSQRDFFNEYLERMEREGLTVPKEIIPCKTNKTTFYY